VVASPIIVYLVSGRPPSLNPLHCGAVVASGALRKALPALAPESQSPSLRGSGRFCLRHVLENDPDLVSIPFIAGQWSLRRPTWRHGVQEVWSQSPSLRGSGRFREPRCGRPTAARPVSIPFIAGQWSLPRAALPRRTRGLRVSIPFIAGQWSLHPEGDYPVYRCIKVSIPFIAGQWSLRRRRAGFRRQERGLNPLHCGAVVASEASTVIMELQALFQSPSLRGSGRFPLPLRQCHSSC